MGGLVVSARAASLSAIALQGVIEAEIVIALSDLHPILYKYR